MLALFFSFESCPWASDPRFSSAIAMRMQDREKGILGGGGAELRSLGGLNIFRY